MTDPVNKPRVVRCTAIPPPEVKRVPNQPGALVVPFPKVHFRGELLEVVRRTDNETRTNHSTIIVPPAQRIAWEQIQNALENLPTVQGRIRLPDIHDRLTKIGYQLDLQASDKKAVYRFGSRSLQIRQRFLGSFPVLALKMNDDGAFAKKSGKRFLIGGTLLKPDVYQGIMRERYHQVRRHFRGALGDFSRTLPTHVEGLKRFIALGESKGERAETARRKRHLLERVWHIARKMKAMQDQGTLPKGFVVYFDGPDGAGKSSTAKWIWRIFKRVGIESQFSAFKTPKDSIGQPPIERYRQRGRPQPQTAMFWDRGPAGDAVYGGLNRGACVRHARNFCRYEQELRNDGVMMLKAFLYATPTKQADIFGKRTARQDIANELELLYRQRGQFTEKIGAAIQEIRSTIKPAEFQSIRTFDQVLPRFEDFAKLTSRHSPTHVLDASKRYPTRLELLDAFEAQLDAWSEAKLGSSAE